MTKQQRDALIAAALKARQKAYAPYSKLLVGAAILTSDFRVHAGCNVENASYGLTLCAERAALSAAVSAGERQFVALAVASAGAVTPCGACRQVLAEFGGSLPILLIDAADPQRILETDLSHLLPAAFTGEWAMK